MKSSEAVSSHLSTHSSLCRNDAWSPEAREAAAAARRQGKSSRHVPQRGMERGPRRRPQVGSPNWHHEQYEKKAAAGATAAELAEHVKGRRGSSFELAGGSYK